MPISRKGLLGANAYERDETDDQWWERMKAMLQSARATRPAVPSVEEFEAELDALDPTEGGPLSEDEIDRLLPPRALHRFKIEFVTSRHETALLLAQPKDRQTTTIG